MSFAKCVLDETFASLQNRYPDKKITLARVQSGAEHVIDVIDQVGITAVNVGKRFTPVYHLIRNQNLDEFLPMFAGLIMCFFGSYYTMIIAVIETMRVLCWDNLRSSYAVLKRSYEVAIAVKDKDDIIEADRSGANVVEQLDSHKQLSHKLAIFLRSLDVEEIRCAARTLLSALFAVIAALRIRFVRTFALGQSLASMARQHLNIDQFAMDVLPAELQRASSLIVDVTLNVICVVIAFVFSLVIISLQSAIRGAHIFASHALRVAQARGLVDDNTTLQSRKVQFFIIAMSTVGFLWQMSHHGHLPFPLNVILFPVTVVEYLLHFITLIFFYAAPAY